MTVLILFFFHWNYRQIISRQGGVRLFDCGILCFVLIEKNIAEERINSEANISGMLKGQPIFFLPTVLQWS